MKKGDKKFVEWFKGMELALVEGKTKPTIYHNWRKYIRVKLKNKRSSKWYSIRYIRKKDLDNYFKEDEW